MLSNLDKVKILSSGKVVEIFHKVTHAPLAAETMIERVTL